MRTRNTNSSGFIRAIVLIVIALALFAYWGYDVKKVLSSPELKEKVVFIWEWTKDLWNNYALVWLQWIWSHGGESLYTSVKDLLTTSSDTSTATSTPEL